MGEKMTEGIGSDQLIPGEIAEREVKHSRTSSGLRYEHRLVEVGDQSTIEGRARLNSHLNLLNDMVVDNPEWPIPGNGETNPASEDFYQSHLNGTSMQYWREHHVPHAEALYPLQRLDDAGRLFPDGHVDDYGMDIFTNAIDSIAIRARGAIHNEILLKVAAKLPAQRLNAVALGAGAGVPNINATRTIKDELNKSVSWREYDFSYTSLKLSKTLFQEAGLPEEDVETVRGDYSKSFDLEPGSVDIIDMLGLWEYLSTERCKKALEELPKLLKPGGVLVISNMLLDRPQLEVNQTVIGWPGVKPRTIDELISIAADAGIDTDSITVTTSADGVYAVMEIPKS